MYLLTEWEVIEDLPLGFGQETLALAIGNFPGLGEGS